MSRTKNMSAESKSKVTDKKSKPTVIDVARLAGVSPGTVSNTLNATTFVEPETRARVEDAVRRLGYVPNLRARRLRMRRADTIAIIPGMSLAVSGGSAKLGFTLEIAASAAQRAMESNMALVLVPPSFPAGGSIADLHMDGALIIEPLMDDPNVALLEHLGIPVVSIGRQSEQSALPYVDLRQYESAGILVRHLMERGSRRMALVVGAQLRFTHAQTEAAYREIMRENGREEIVRHVDEGGGDKLAETVVSDLLNERPDIDGIFVSVDAFAVGACRAAIRCGRSIPGDLIMATRYDGNLARGNNPPITALDLHLDSMADKAVEKLLDMMAGQPAPAMIEGPGATLVERMSTERMRRNV